MAELIGLSYSPWSQKARWALDHHRVPYRFREYLPLLGEPWLRLRLRRGRVTVPVLIDEAGVHADSFDIARRAEQIGRGAPLFPADAVDAIARWNQLSEDACAAGRALATAAVLADPEALRESAPAFVPGPLRGPLARTGARFLQRKYGLGRLDPAAARETLGLALEAVREARGREARDHLVGETLSYADVAMAVAFQFVEPPAERFVRLGPRSRACWTVTDLAERYADVLGWRDRIYAHHHPARDGARGGSGDTR